MAVAEGRRFTVTTPDGLSVAAEEWGNPNGPEILFIHGLMQCRLAWRRQVADPALAAEFRMVAYDLRGHGASDRPDRPEAYREDRPWADELAAVIAAAGLRRPVAVAWSYAGRVVTDYLRTHGSGPFAGINFVAAVTKSTDRALYGPKGGTFGGITSEDLATMIEATRAFVRACFEHLPAADELEQIVAYNMLVPRAVRAHLGARKGNPGDLLPGLRLPVLASQGDRDALIGPAMSRLTVEQVPGAVLSLYEGIGHAPFAEDAPRFNRELAAFVRSATGSR